VLDGTPLGQVFIDNCRDVRVAGVETNGRGYRIFAARTDGLSFEDNRFAGGAVLNVEGYELSNLTVRGNRVEAGDSGFSLTGVEDALVEENEFSGTYGGFSITDASRIHVQDNRMTETRAGIGLDDCQDVVVERNRLEGVGNRYSWMGWYYPDRAGAIEISGCTSALVAENNVTGGGRGISVDSSRDVMITGNEVAGMWGIHVSGYNVSVVSNRLRGHSTDYGWPYETAGIESYGSGAMVVEDNIIEGAWNLGIHLWGHRSPIIRGNQVTGASQSGIALQGVTDPLVEGNTLIGSADAGILLAGSHGAVLRGNVLVNDSIQLDGDRTSLTSHSIGPDNTVNGLPVLYFKECGALVVDGALAGEVIIADCGKVLLKNLSMQGADLAIFVAWVSSVSVIDSHLSNYTTNAVLVRDSAQVWVHNVTFQGGGIGVRADRTSRLTISSSTFDHLETGVRLEGTNTTVIEGNHFERDGTGIWSRGSDYMEIRQNVFAANSQGIYAADSLDLRVYHNDFERNDVHARIGRSPAGENIRWDDGYPSGGNYWWNFSSVDKRGGPSQVETLGADGIWDTPYVDEYVNDRYPLVSPMNGGGPTTVPFEPLDWGDEPVTVIMPSPDDNGTEYRYRIDPGGHWKEVPEEEIGGGNVKVELPPGDFPRIVEVDRSTLIGDSRMDDTAPGEASGTSESINPPTAWVIQVVAGGLLAGAAVFLLLRLRPRGQNP
jgi:parallel beta-helix repeat protein